MPRARHWYTGGMLTHLKTLRSALAATAREAPETLSSGPSQAAPGDDAALDLLGLAIASLEKLALTERAPQLCQIAVLGPTQAGKSTLTNLLVGAEVTSVSALAGHTRHARGAAVGVEEAVLQQISQALHPARRVAGPELSSTDLDQYSLMDVATTALPAFAAAADGKSPPCIVWDTPDFDSLAADTYRRAVLAIAGLADVVVLIVSRDKYGDMAVWELLERLTLLQRRSLLVVNKVDPTNWEELAAHIEATQIERLGGAPFEVAAIQHAAAGEPVQAGDLLNSLEQLAPVPPTQVQRGVCELLDRGWDAWLAPVLAEDEAQARWRERLTLGKTEFLDAYRRDYLKDAERYDTFQRLLGELLVLLEIPMLARTMGSVRKAVTWPVRKLFGQREQDDSHGREPELLVEGAEHLLLALRMSALEDGQAEVFASRVAARLNADQTRLLVDFRAASIEHHNSFQESVAVAAQELYQRLQETPALLNSLRAIRASADAAGVVVALQTGGIGLADLVLTPVMLSLTSTLTESAAKTYVDQVVAELQEQQYSAVAAVLDNTLLAELAAYAEDPTLLQFAELDAAALSEERDAFVASVGGTEVAS